VAPEFEMGGLHSETNSWPHYVSQIELGALYAAVSLQSVCDETGPGLSQRSGYASRNGHDILQITYLLLFSSITLSRNKAQAGVESLGCKGKEQNYGSGQSVAVPSRELDRGG